MTKKLPLTIGNKYIFIDSIYVNDFTQAESTLLLNTSLADLRPILFPYSTDPYAIFQSDTSQFDLSRIDYLFDEEGTSCEINQFCSDSGVILVIDEQSFLAVVKEFDSDKLYDYLMNPSDQSWWATFLKKYESRLFWFYTSDIKEEFGGGGNFQID